MSYFTNGSSRDKTTIQLDKVALEKHIIINMLHQFSATHRARALHTPHTPDAALAYLTLSTLGNRNDRPT